ncbi:MAG: hypothetical protein HAW66_00370 [Shewanella sp.]|nr:hypothetical protein [Shewanella sp.]
MIKINRLDIVSTKQEKKLLKKKNKQLAKQTYQELKRQIVKPTKKALKQKIHQTIKQIVEPLESQNDAVYSKNIQITQLDSTVINIVSTDALIFKPDDEIQANKPFKKKPCGDCPALKNGLCRCALKMMATNGKVG